LKESLLDHEKIENLNLSSKFKLFKIDNYITEKGVKELDGIIKNNKEIKYINLKGNTKYSNKTMKLTNKFYQNYILITN
jgi:hypothetical protein